MATRPQGYGLSGEVSRKIRAKYSIELEQEAREWLEQVLREPLDPSADPHTPLGDRKFGECLRNGQLLCKLMNTLVPGSIKKIHQTKMAAFCMENIGNFLAAAEKYGVSKTDQFDTADLYEFANMTQVVNCLHAVGRAAQKNGFAGPSLGVKESTKNVRDFTPEVLNAGQTVIGLQMGSNKGANQAGMNIGKTRAILD